MVAGGCYHVINRGNNRSTIFCSPGDYAAFVRLLTAARERIPLDILAACLMPNHFHLVVMPTHRTDISRWMHWLLTTHTHRFHRCHDTCGRVWQGRFKAFPIEKDHHLLTVMRYVERNALRAGLVARAQDWPWSSLAWRNGTRRPMGLLAEPPVGLPKHWTEFVNEPQTPEEMESLRNCVNRQRPFGDDRWVEAAAGNLGLEASVRPRGRPRKTQE
jgi:putative transposase